MRLGGGGLGTVFAGSTSLKENWRKNSFVSWKIGRKSSLGNRERIK
jgi:hypothetical protein